jgi:WD40 repeat protein
VPRHVAFAVGIARVWSAGDGRFLDVLKGHTAFVKALAFSPDGKTLATGSFDSTIKLWNVTDFAQPPLTLQGHTAAVYGVIFSPDGKRLLSGSRDTTARVDAIDVGDLVRIAHTRVTRSLTTAECQQYLHRSTCPR